MQLQTQQITVFRIYKKYSNEKLVSTSHAFFNETHAQNMCQSLDLRNWLYPDELVHVVITETLDLD